jgi:hypothetical protein
MNVLDRAHILLNIIEKLAGHPGQFADIRNAAAKELQAINDFVAKSAVPSPESYDPENDPMRAEPHTDAGKVEETSSEATDEVSTFQRRELT